MNARGQYGTTTGQRQTHVGARLVHTLELKQRYDNARAAAVQALLSELSGVGVASSVGPNRWEIALKDGAWVRLVWYPDHSALELTVTDRELRSVDEDGPRSSATYVRNLYEAILRKITPRLQTYGATTVGAATYAGQQAPPQRRLAARTRAIRAVFDMYTHTRAPYYIYAEVNGLIDKRSATSLDEANAIFFVLERSPGEIYVAIFDPTDRLWPGPAADTYRAAPQDRPTVAGRSDTRGEYGPLVGLKIYHSVGDRADAVKQMAVDWSALYQNLARQAGVIIADPASPSGYRILTQREWEANPPDPKKVSWWKSYAEPLFKQWGRFKLDQLGGDRTVADDYISFAERFQTNWDVYEGWKTKLDNLRSEAAKRGFTVDAPKPADLPTTVWADVAHTVEKGAEKLGSGLGDVWTFVKYGAWAALGVGAVVAVSSIVSNLRSGKDPAEKYVEMIRESRRARASRALPERRPQLALPPGPATEGA